MMRIGIGKRIVMICSLLLLSNAAAFADKLTDSDRKKVIDKLTKITDDAKQSSNKRFGNALKDYRKAIQSDSAALSLYLKCVEKVKFLDQKRKPQDFRDWKRQLKPKHDEPGFRRALRHQINWLMLTMEASAKPDQIEDLGADAVEKLDQLFEDHELLNGYTGILKMNVLATEFAKAYDLNGLAAKKWPLSPLEIGQIYSITVMPKLREDKKVEKLRAAWNKRIKHEGLKIEKWSQSKEKMAELKRKGERVPEYQTWLENGCLVLLWAKEMDCYRLGDERNSVNAMLGHIEENVDHKFATKWTKSLLDLLKYDSADLSQ